MYLPIDNGEYSREKVYGPDSHVPHDTSCLFFDIAIFHFRFEWDYLFFIFFFVFFLSKNSYF